MNIHEYFQRTQEEFRSQNLNVLYYQLRQNSQICGDFQCAPAKARLHVYSISKSFVSCACGIAVQEGLLSLDETISDSFREHLPEMPSPYLLRLTPHHLLTMNSGLKDPLFFSDSPERYQLKDWISHFFHADFTKEPGTDFLYSNLNTYILSCLIEKRAGMNLLEYLRNRLFEPLEIGNPDWTLCPQGHVHAAFGLYLNIDELSRFGEMLRGNGLFEGKQLVPEEYMKQAFRKQTFSKDTFGSDAFRHGYGYQFWCTPVEGVRLCFGGYGQFCLVWPKKDLVCSILSFEGKKPAAILDILLKYLPLLD